jgi:hypothetical protein
MTILSGLFFLRQPLSQGLGRGLSMAGETVRRASSRFGTATALAGALLLTAAALAAFGLALSNMRQLTSELGRVWLIVGAAWFFFLRWPSDWRDWARRACRSGVMSSRCFGSSAC